MVFLLRYRIAAESCTVYLGNVREYVIQMTTAAITASLAPAVSDVEEETVVVFAIGVFRVVCIAANDVVVELALMNDVRLAPAILSSPMAAVVVLPKFKPALPLTETKLRVVFKLLTPMVASPPYSSVCPATLKPPLTEVKCKEPAV